MGDVTCVQHVFEHGFADSKGQSIASWLNELAATGKVIVRKDFIVTLAGTVVVAEVTGLVPEFAYFDGTKFLWTSGGTST